MSRLAIFLLIIFAPLAGAQIGGFGVMGDSLSDEYFEETYGAYATNWVQQLVAGRSINFGPTGNWGLPRRNGYQFNWALSGDTSADLLANGQHTGLTAQTAPNNITHAVLAIGANDFHPQGNAYFNIYFGFWSPSTINSYVAQTLTNIEIALATVVPTGTQLVLFNILDYGKTPAVYTTFPYTSGNNRERVAAAIQQANAGLAFLAQKYQVPLVDAFALQKIIFGANTNLQTTLAIGNVTINLQQGDTDPFNNPNRTAAFVADRAHPHTTIQGIFANMTLEAIRLGYDTDVPIFSEQEILAHAGLAYGGLDTLLSRIGSYANYIILPVRARVTGLGFAGADVQIQFTTASNQSYRVEMSPSLTNPVWTLHTNNVPGTGGTVQVLDPGAGTQPSRYYRVRQLP